MKLTYIGDLPEFTLRGVTFKKGTAVDVTDENLAAKCAALDFFKVGEAKPARKAKD